MQGMFSKAIVRRPGTNFGEGLTTVQLGAPDYRRAVEQHEAYCVALKECGLTVTHLEPDERYPDSTFVEDTAVLVGALPQGRPSANPVFANPASVNRAILTRPGATSRIGEVAGIAEVLRRSYSELHSIDQPGTLDGGDVCEAGNNFFIGISERTNETGAQQLAKLLASFGYVSRFVDIRGLTNILHLKSGLAYLGDNRLVITEALASDEEFRGYDLIRVNPGEEYAANCVRVNGRVLVAAGYAAFEARLRGLGYQTITPEMSEFQKMDGGLSCLSLRF